ncbi:MAG: SDR family NAD(P)-dependent oxidoreductase [Halioglobus sp.]
MSQNKITALVTGASAGMGEQFCEQLAERCDVIIAVGLRKNRLDELAQRLKSKTEVHPLSADLTTVEGVAATMEALRQKGPVDYLVNNAGFSTYGNFPDLGIEDQRAMVSLHVDASMTLCKAAVGFMVERGSGHIINVSSLGSFLPGAGLAVYAATKAFLNNFSLGLHAELAGTGVEVQALCPGYTHTEFHDAMADEGFDKGEIDPDMWMDASEVVAASLAALGTGQVLVVPGEKNQQLARYGLKQQLAALGAES